MEVNQKIHGFKVKRIRPLNELKGELIEMTHENTGLELIWIKREEENKTFGIAFETIPFDDTGVFHILEHSVLCGSDKFRVKEPFVELLKNSMNTFLNALTYPDKTVYPVSSKNPKDFLNLMNVYLDAVLHPLIYSKPEIFYQEGWHYEFDENGEPSYKGVVYNEMRGAFADANELIADSMNRAMFPDTCYKFVSGGDPESIPDLTYEGFIDTHRRFYSPSNAYVFMDGDIDIDAALSLLESYLKDFARTERIPYPAMQKPVDGGEIHQEYEIGPEEDPSRKTRLAFGRVIGDFSQREKLIAMQILSDVLCGNNQAPLSKALLSQGLAEDVIMAGADDVIAQPWLKLEARNISADDREKVEKIIFSTLKELSEGGLDHSQIESAMANLEFHMRERDYGYWPGGLILGFSIMDSCLYGGDPKANLEIGDLFVNLRKKMDEGYFEALIKDVLLDNPHKCTVVLTPSHTAGEERAKKEQERLKKEQNIWNESDKAAFLKRQEKLLAWQNSEDLPEELAKIPHLELSDLSDEPENIPTEVLEKNNITVLRHDIDCSGIVYYNMFFDADGLTEEEYSRLSFLSSLYGEMKTKKHSEEELVNLTRLLLGNVNCGVTSTELTNSDRNKTKLCLTFGLLEENNKKAVELMLEVITETLFDNGEVALDILRQQKNGMRQKAVMAGQAIGFSRVNAQYTVSGVVNENTGGLNYYKWLVGQEKDWNWDKLSQELKETAEKIINKNTVTLSVTGGNDKLIDEAVSIITTALPDRPALPKEPVIKPWGKRKECIAIPADISFAVSGGSMLPYGGGYSGEALVAFRIISLAYLWNMVRVQGGAYGTGLQCFRSGLAGCYSYRDPNAANSLDVYGKAADFLREFCENGGNGAPDLTGFIIGTVSDSYPLLTPRMKGASADGWYWGEISFEKRKEMYRQIKYVTPEKLIEIANQLKKALEDGGVCVVGAKSQLDLCGKFDVTESL